jgi:hypothetical protein
MRWLSGDPAFGKFPAGPVLFIAVSAIVIWGARWWWKPMIGGLISILTTSGWFALLPRECWDCSILGGWADLRPARRY